MYGCSNELKPDTGRIIMATELLALSAMGVVTIIYRRHKQKREVEEQLKNDKDLMKRLVASSMLCGVRSSYGG